MIPFRRVPAPPIATPEDGRNKVVISCVDWAESPLAGDFWYGVRIYTDSGIFSGEPRVYPMKELYYDYDGTEDAYDKGGINAVINLLSKKYKVTAYPLGVAQHGLTRIYIGGVSPEYGHFDSRCAGIIMFSEDFENKEVATEEVMENILERYTDYVNGDVYQFELINGKGDSVDMCNPYYGTDELVEGVVSSIKYAKWKDFIVASEGECPVSEYIEEDILKALGENVFSGNRRPVKAVRKKKTTVKPKSAPSEKRKSVKSIIPTKRKTAIKNRGGKR